jgi:hypothetical protein
MRNTYARTVRGSPRAGRHQAFSDRPPRRQSIHRMIPAQRTPTRTRRRSLVCIVAAMRASDPGPLCVFRMLVGKEMQLVICHVAHPELLRAVARQHHNDRRIVRYPPDRPHQPAKRGRACNTDKPATPLREVQRRKSGQDPEEAHTRT